MSKGSKGWKGSREIEESPLSRNNIEYLNGHLPAFEQMDRALGLRGEDYKPYKKALWYSMASMPVRKTKVKLGDIKHDLRIHAAFPIPSGGGKKAIVNLMEDIFEDRYEVVKPSLFHPDQLIGKTKRVRDEDGDQRTEIIYGHLDSKLFIKDEAYKIFGSDAEKYKETRSYLNEALDPHKKNRITKRNVDTPKGDELSYFPENNTLLFFQPLSIDSDSVREGLIRRFIIPYSRFPKRIRSQAYRERANPEEEMSRDKAIEILKEDFVKEIAKGTDQSEVEELSLEKNLVEKFNDYHESLVQQGFAHTEEGREYANMVDFSLQDTLLKMAGIQAKSRKNKKIREEDLNRAFIDLTELLACKLDYIRDHLFEDIKYPSDVSINDSRILRCMKYLKENGAESKEDSDISAAKFKKKIRSEFDKKTAEPQYYDMQEADLIGYDQIGRTETRIWLKVDPDEIADPEKKARLALQKNQLYQRVKNKVYSSQNPWNPQCPTERLEDLGFKEFWTRLEEKAQNPQKTGKKHLSSGGLS